MHQGPFSGVALSSPSKRAACAACANRLGGNPSISSGRFKVMLKALLASRTWLEKLVESSASSI